VNFATQISDFDPGITPYPEGLFWTVPLADDGVEVNFGAGRASMKANNLALSDFFNIPNALFRFQSPVSAPAVCSFDVHWSGPVTDRSKVDDPVVGFAGQFLLNQATMTWSAVREGKDGFSFVSDPAPTTSAFAQLGKMRNGVFFNDGD
jgi:hypothetical protein